MSDALSPPSRPRRYPSASIRDADGHLTRHSATHAPNHQQPFAIQIATRPVRRATGVRT